MSNYCSDEIWFFSTVPEFGAGWYASWNKTSKKSTVSYQGSDPIGFVQVSDGFIIDVIDKSGSVYLVVVDHTSGGTNIVKGKLIILSSTRGDYSNKLLYTKRTGNTLDVYMYALTAKEVTHYTFTNSFDSAVTPCYNEYSLDTNVAILQWCEDTTLKTIKHNGIGGVTEFDEINSLTCGYIDQSGQSPPLTNIKITQTINIEYRTCILRNPVFMVWKNTMGGWDSWLFERTQTENIDTATLGSFVNDYIRIGDITNNKTEIGKSGNPRTTYTAMQLTLQQKTALSQIFYTNKISIVNKDGSIKADVIITPGSFLIQETMDQLHSISFEAQLPEINTIRN